MDVLYFYFCLKIPIPVFQSCNIFSILHFRETILACIQNHGHLGSKLPIPIYHKCGHLRHSPAGVSRGRAILSNTQVEFGLASSSGQQTTSRQNSCTSQCNHQVSPKRMNIQPLRSKQCTNFFPEKHNIFLYVNKYLHRPLVKTKFLN